jgi:hypothetical protein
MAEWPELLLTYFIYGTPNTNTFLSFNNTIKSPTGPRLLLDSTALHCSAGCQPPPTTTQETVLGVGEVLVWCQKIAWVSPARPTLPSDSKSRAYGSYSHGETDLRLICTWTDRQSVRTIEVHEWNRLNSVFETEFSLPFLPIFRNDAMALVGSQGTILSTMASISSINVAA